MSEEIKNKVANEFTQNIRMLTRGVRYMLKRGSHSLKRLGVEETLRPSSKVSDLIRVLSTIAGNFVSIKESSAEPVEMQAFRKGLVSLRGRMNFPLKKFGVEDVVRPNTKLSDFMGKVVY